MHVDGQCLCGFLAYEAEVDAASVLICNCSDCQVLSGSAFRVTVPVLDNSFKLVRGEPRTYVKIAASGRKRVLGFCPECGTSVYSRPEDGEAGYFGLRVGSLNQRAKLVPREQIWRRTAQGWIDHIADLPASETE
jgi:hypothetical protein